MPHKRPASARWVRRALGLLWPAVLAALLGGCAWWRPAPPVAGAADAVSAGALARSWLAAPEGEAPAAGAPPPASSAAHAPEAIPPALQGWADFGQALALADAERREAALRAVHREATSPLLQATVLRAIREDAGFQGRQARFLRRYGFYANWFNRLLFSAGRVLQGNVQAAGQLVIDSVHDLFRPPEATEYERRALVMLRRREILASSGRVDRAELDKLERGVERALAQADVERAGWALDHGDADAAAFYARQAQARQPEWKRATHLVSLAESRVAERRREALASSQVGYPDRTPQVLPAPPALLRALLLDDDGAGEGSDSPLVTAALAAYPVPGRAQSSTRYRNWGELLAARGRQAPPDQSRWLAAVLASPELNPDLRLTQARERRRGQYSRYIFVGPERTRERAYKAATWFNQAFDALQNVGFFYVFEVLGRAGQVVFAPPVPAEEVLDAQGAWLRNAPDPQGPEARTVADEMARELERQQRFDRARQLLTLSGQLTEERRGKLNRKEARQLLDQADALSTGPQRTQLTARARALAPELVSKRERRWAKRRDPDREPYTLTTDWAQLAAWSGLPPPCSLPGQAQWFDGQRGNQEAAQAVQLRIDPAALTLTVSCRLYGERGGGKPWQQQVPLAAIHAELRRMLLLAREQTQGAHQDIQALDRLPIPFSLEGGIGAGGVDFYPQLLPIQPKAGELELYQ